ncbi:MAG: hypothetical protein N3B18_13675 [Desulfobacterota bacterium]|nr:hypothetical protein [Thermodesulfobacteriota bacterium]
MKRNACYGIMLIILVCLFAAGCSRDRSEKIRGIVVSLSVDSEKNTVVIKEDKTGQQKTIVVAAEDMKKLQPGLKISARLKKGSNIADSVRVKTIHPPKAGELKTTDDNDRNDHDE